MGHVSRSTGRSCVQSVAYITRSCLQEDRRGITADYRSRDVDVFWETLAPEGSGIDKKNLDIWNKLESYEDTYADKRYKNLDAINKYKATARTAQTYVYALPRELTLEQNIDLIRNVVNERFVSKGLISTFGIHWEEGNPHVHIQVSERAILPDGTFSYVKVARELSTPKALKETRKIFADKTNDLFQSLGMDVRVDHRSFVERLIDLVPPIHKGYTAHQLEREGLSSRIGKENEQISEANKERIAREPGIIIKELSSTQATFSEMDVIRLMQKRLKDDMGILGDHVLHGVMKNSVEVGIGIDNSKRYTSQEYADKEAKVLECFEVFQANKARIKIDPNKVEELLGRLEEQGKERGFKPNEGQINGIRTLCGDGQISVLIGRAGTGKTTTMAAVVQLHKEAGFNVIGMAPSATAATQLEADTGCKSDTIAHYAYYWNKYDEALGLLYAATTDKEMSEAQKAIDKYSAYLPNSDTVIIVDEAGMVGVGDRKGSIPGGWDAITKTIDSTGAKLILTGDDHQFKPIEAGDVFRRLIYQLKEAGQQGADLRLSELTEIMRQRHPWMREASGHFAELNVATALGMYENQGHIKEHALNTEVYKDIAEKYLGNVKATPNSKGIVVAATNEERLALNREIRAILKDNGLLPKEDLLQRGEDGYTVGDRIVFAKNDRGWNTSFESKKEGFFTQNSMKAVIQSIKPIRIKDEETGEITDTHEIVAHVPDHEATIKFNLENFRDFSHGYAVTGWKSQGNTLDWVIAKLSKYMDAHALYVIATRHREDISMHYSKEDFSDYKALVHSLSRANVKDLVVDYSVSDENKEFWQNVQDYKETGRELQGIRTLARSLDKENKEELKAVWENYREVEADRKSWAKFILEDWESHKDFTRQAGLTRESLEIAAGFKKRSLSRVEIEAQQVVEQYIAVSLEARELWRDIRRTHPGSRAKLHPEWPKFEDARDQRGTLANQIHINPVLHRPFLKETAENLAKEDVGYVTRDQKVSYSMGTIQVQAETHQSKMLQAQLLKDNAEGRPPPNPALQDMLKVLIAYTENRDMAGAISQEVRPKLKEFEGTLLKESFSKAISEYTEVRMKRDAAAFQIVERREAFTDLADKVGMKLDFEKLGEQAVQATRDRLFKTYQSSPEEMTKLEAAFEINAMVKGEAELGKKPTISQVYQQGLQPKDIGKDVLEYRKLKLFEGLKTEAERSLFLLLDEYDSKCRTANQIYGQCIEETKDKGKNAWESSHYPAYKAVCNSRNDIALEVFDQRDHNQVLAMAEAMGMRFKETELQEIFSRCEQATRTNNIISYLKAEDPEAKGKAAVTIRQMIEFERRESGSASKTAQQAYHSGIDFKELQATAFDYGRSCILKGLSSEKEIQLYHSLEAYENAFRPANRAYKDCIDESKAKTTTTLEVKPWETEKYKEYISLVAVQDEKAHQLIKGHDAGSINKIAKEMGISPKKLDVEAHRHSLRQMLQTFTEGDRTNVPMAAREVLNWLEFDRHSEHKHTFKVLREQDLWPDDVQKGLQQFFEKKREWRQEAQHELKDAAKVKVQDHNRSKPEYQTITYERYQSFEEVDKQLKERMFELATEVLGNPTSRTSTQLRFGRKGSICVFTNGPKQGLYANHETGVYGGPLKLIEEQAGLSSARDALKWGSEWLGGNSLVIEQRIVEKAPEVKQPEWTWTPITPVPKELENPDIEGHKYLSRRLAGGSKVDARYAYRDETGKLLGYVVRIIKPDGSKETPPLAYCHGKNSINGNEFDAWQWKGFFTQERIPYGLEKLKQDPNKPILVVEGEKTADAAQKLLPEYHVLTWLGGAGAVDKTNWACLIGKEVTIWPDYDYNQGGQIAAEKLQKIVTQLNMEAGIEGRVGIVKLPPLTPGQTPLLKNKWDLADKLPKGWTLDTVKQMIKDTVPLKNKAVVMAPEVEGRPPGAINIGNHERGYTSQEKQILDYLRQELMPEKTPWLEKSDCEKFLNAAAENPAHTLQRWQKITDDYSFEIPLDQSGKLAGNLGDLNDQQIDARKTQETEILTYLHNEVSAQKHEWLPPEHAKDILNAAKDDPFAALDRWKELSGDDSFEPSIPDTLMSDEQKNIKRNILGYLKENMQLNEEDIDGKAQQKILKVAENNPDKGLQEWQILTGNYDYNPYADRLGLRELKVNEYLREKLGQHHDRLSQTMKLETTNHLHSNPLKAYDFWQLYSNDKTFDPKTGIPTIETQAQKLMDSIKSPIPDDLLKSWQNQITNNPVAVLQECQAFIQDKNAQDMLHKSVNQFIHLSENYEKLSWNDPQRDKIEQGIQKITNRYLNDKEFIEKVEGSKSQAASERLANEMREKERVVLQNVYDRGMGM